MKQGVLHSIGRHGETARNAGKPSYRGWKEVPENQLSEQGIKDAEGLGRRIKRNISNPKDHVIVSSDLNRARHSAEIAAITSGIKVGKAYKDLRSMDTGDFTGKPVHIHQETIDNHIKDTPHIPLKGASESYNDFIKRLKGAFGKKLGRDYPGKNIIVISHNQVEVLHAHDFKPIGPEEYKKGIKPGHLRLI